MRNLTPEERRKAIEEMTPNPNPRIVALLDFALSEVIEQLGRKNEYADWLAWAREWRAGDHYRPRRCVNVAHRCFEHKGWGLDGKATNPVWHALGQLAWGAKEACYNAPKSGWLTLRYIADAMIAFGIAFPDRPLLALDRPNFDADAQEVRLLAE